MDDYGDRRLAHEHDRPAFRVPVLQDHAAYLAQQVRATYATRLYRAMMSFEIIGMQRRVAVLYSVARSEYHQHYGK